MQPLPPGLPPNFAPGAPLPPGMPPPVFAAPPPMEMIPQPVAPTADLAVASTVVSEGASNASKVIGLAPSIKPTSTSNSTKDDTKKKGSNLVFSGVNDDGVEVSMEELRMKSKGY